MEMAKRMDLGAKISATAKALTPDQVSELLAIRLANLHPSQTPIGPWHWKPGGTAYDLQRLKLITAEAVPEWSLRGWKRTRMTEFGERVLLSLAEDALVETGRMQSLWDTDEAA